MKNYQHALKNRRELLQTSIKAGLMMPFISGHTTLFTEHASQTNRKISAQKAPHPLNILILGGTSFLGPQQVAYAMGRGHAITIFTRGQTKPTTHKSLFKNVEQLTGDREDNLEALRGRKWDAVIDNSGRRAKWTRDSALLLRENVDLYLYTSSTGVYYPYLGSDIREETELVLQVPEGINEEQALEYDYGVMKAKSEMEARSAFGEDRTIVVRPTYMMGPGDKTDRFTYWPARLSRGGTVMVPGQSQDPVQYIDVRDVAAWMIRLIESRTTGTFNAVGPASPTGMHAFVYGAHAAFSSAVSFVMIPDYEFLTKHKVPYAIPWIMPTGDNAGSALVSNQLGIANGLTFTPLAESVRDIYEWWQSDAVPEERRIKMVSGEGSLMAREEEIIAAWKKHK